MAATNGQQTNGDADLVIPIQINGKEEQLTSTFDVVNPATGKVIWKSASASKDDARRAVDAARAALPAWRKTKAPFRRDIFLKAADILESRAGECEKYLCEETGAVEFFAGFNTHLSVQFLRDVAGRIVNAITGALPECAEEGRSMMVLKEPYGVVFGIAPWNAPFVLGIRACLYALAAGNTVVLKGAELSPRVYWSIGTILKEAGLPDGCLNVLAYRPEDAPAITKSIIENPLVKKVNFTGSTAVGSIISEICGKNLKPCLMELGGKNSAIVLDDADIEVAARECAQGSFFHAGQICMSTDRIIVQSSILPSFKEAFGQAVSKLFPSSGPALVLASAGGTKKPRAITENALKEGGKLIHGDLEEQGKESATRMRPMVVEGIKKGMDLYSEEAFGPTVGIMEIQGEEEAVGIMNDTGYGLSAAVFSKDWRRAMRIAREIEAGAVHINRWTVHDEPNLPHGGVARSGWGRFNANAGFEEFLKTKNVTWMDDW